MASSLKASEPPARHASADELTDGQKQELYNKFGLMEGAHTIGVVNLVLTIIVAIRWPQFFWLLHLLKACIYMPWKFVLLKRVGSELFLLEFCYFNTYYSAIGCVMTFVRVFFGIWNPLHPWNSSLIRVGFAFANGALLLSIPIFGDKLVFHDVNNTISTFVHLSPATMYWTLRWGGGFGTSLIDDWWPDMFEVCPDMHAVDVFQGSLWHLLWSPDHDCRGTVTEFMGYASLFWIFFWGLPYALIMFCCLAGYIERNGKKNLYMHTLTSKNLMGRVLHAAPEKLKPLVYMLSHFVMTSLGTSISIVLWNSFILNTLYVSGIALVAVHNASKYMFRYVAAKEIPREIDRIAHSEDNLGAYQRVGEAP